MKMIKLCLFFTVLAPLAFSMDYLEDQRGRTRERDILPYDFDELLDKTRHLFNTTSDYHPFKRSMFGVLSAMLSFRSIQEVVNNKSYIAVFLDCYNDNLRDFNLQEYASCDIDADGINFALLNHSQKKILMVVIIYYLNHLFNEEHQRRFEKMVESL